MRKRFSLMFAAVILTASVFVSTAAANHSWGGYHWARTSNPFTVKLGKNLTGAWPSILNTTSSDWSQSTVLDTTIVAGQSAQKRCRATAGQDEICNNTYGNNGWLGVAQIWLASGSLHITQGTVKLNDTYFNTPQYNTTAWRNLVSCQEVGHTFGLDHQDENFNNSNLGTCMDYTNDPSTNQHPNNHDYDQLFTIYSHLDSTTTVGAAAPSSLAQSEDAAPIATERRDRIGNSTIVEKFADGSRRVTNIIWAIPGTAHS
ncbi:MAG: hypothetical protein H0W90_02160 [Actinobacteria bacterium]|nr:hypothetical protein [Actinomycetota bacterium]